MLGRGLESLIPVKRAKEEKIAEPEITEKETEKQPTAKAAISAVSQFSVKKEFDIDDSSKKPSESIFWIETDKIQSNPYQPRSNFNEEAIKELAASIQEVGMLHPLLVSKIEETTESGTRVNYQLIAGERRFLAAKILGLTQVPVIIKKIAANANRLEMAIIENIQRTDLNSLEKARAFTRLHEEFGLTHQEIAQRIGRERTTVSNIIRLLNLPSNIQEALYQNKIKESQAMTLLSVHDLKNQQKLFQELVSGDIYSEQDLRETIKERKIPTNIKDPERTFLEKQLEEFLTAKVKIRKNRRHLNKGQIIIQFFSEEELNDIAKKICGD